MPSSIAHGLAAAGIGALLAPRPVPRGYWVAGIGLATLVDLDAIGRPFGWGDVALLGGHRALTHSLPFAIAAGILVTWLCFWRTETPGRIAVYLVLATASHGLLDLLTPYGAGVALLAPFSDARVLSPWQPFTGVVEVFGIWVPLAVVLLLRGRAPAGLSIAQREEMK